MATASYQVPRAFMASKKRGAYANFNPSLHAKYRGLVLHRL